MARKKRNQHFYESTANAKHSKASTAFDRAGGIKLDSALSRTDENLFPKHLDTVPLKQINCLDSEELDAFLHNFHSSRLKNDISKWNEKLSEISAAIEAVLKKNDGWILMRDNLWYFHQIQAIMPIQKNLETKKGTDSRNNYWPRDIPSQIEFGKHLGRLPLISEIEIIFNSKKCPFLYDTPTTNKRYYTTESLIRSNTELIEYSKLRLLMPLRPSSGKLKMFLKNPTQNAGVSNYLLPILALTKPGEEFQSSQELLLAWLKHGLSPATLPYDDEFSSLHAYYEAAPEIFEQAWRKDSSFTEKVCLDSFFAGKSVLGLKLADLMAESKNGSAVSSQGLLEYEKKRLLDTDLLRADIRPAHDGKMLFDERRGHWDLWAENRNLKALNTLKIKCDFYARNPRADIAKDGIIGIDFGTKSTTAVRHIGQERDRPLRIGHGDYKQLAEKNSDYENPTVMQFIDWQSFQEAYKQKAGRPNTKWQDLTISHTAALTLKESSDSNFFASFLSDLKQWAGRKKTFRLKSTKAKESFELPPFLELSEQELNPLEVYAYYLGLHINSMWQKKIFLRYELSYPVTFDKDVLDKLLSSFERGIKKSLPNSILEDSELMEEFTVRFGASEPAAYALCALQEFGLEPEGEEQIFYAVFDFGGGTTDYDFGVYREADAEEQTENYDYVLTHFKASGDEYLGGENLLQLISYEVFKNNKELLLQKNISFCKPTESIGSSFLGDEGLVDEHSPEANLNMHQLMEKLRPLWEEDKSDKNNSARSELESGKIKVTLFDRAGQQQVNLELHFDHKNLRNIIRQRIKKGVENFFIKLKETFKHPNVPKNTECIHIFLAGNSSKSPLVKELFEENIKRFEATKENKSNQTQSEYFKLHPPLPLEQEDKAGAQNINQNTGQPEDFAEEIVRPTGKTGVAFGLVRGWDGGSIKIINKNKDDEQRLIFQYYVGRAQKNKLVPLLTPDCQKNHWIKVYSVGERGVVPLYYTKLAEGGTGELHMQNAASVNCPVKQPEQKGHFLFMRIHSASMIEYAIAPDEEGIRADQVKLVELGD